MKPIRQGFTTISAFSIIMLSSSLPATACTVNNHVRPADNAADMVHQLIEQKNYKKLDELYDKYLRERTETPDRITALSTFFKGISQPFNHCAKSGKTDEEWGAHKSSLVAWIESAPRSNAAKLALAHHTINEGWRARGNGPASTVSEASQKSFQRHIASAKSQFDALAEIGGNNPAWYEGMLNIGLAQGWSSETVDALYANAAKVDPYYIDIHYAYTNFNTPQWHGSGERLRKSIDRSTELTRQRLGQTMYARLHWSHHQSTDLFKTGGVSWEKMKTGFNDYLEIYSDDKTRNTYAVFACYAEDTKLLKQQLALLGDRVDPEKYGTQKQYAYCKALAANGESGKQASASTSRVRAK